MMKRLCFHISCHKRFFSMPTVDLAFRSAPFSRESLRESLMEQTLRPCVEETLSGGTPPLTKIVATIGPASEDAQTLDKCVGAGMDVMRVNMSHATYEECRLRMDGLDAARLAHSSVVASLLDTRGPEVRLGRLAQTASGASKLEVAEGMPVVLTTDSSFAETSTLDNLYCTLGSLCDVVSVGAELLVDDGLIGIRVNKVDKWAGRVHCTVLNSGLLGSSKSLALPGCTLDLPALTAKDEQDLVWGIQNDMDFIAVSFVRSANDLEAARQFSEQEYAKHHPELVPGTAGWLPPRLIAKIECVEALNNFPEILDACDGIMVARGDLGVEVPLSSVAILQKKMVAAARSAGKIAIVATQMLESMQQNPRPTRSEVSDVTNAIEDGCDAVMLSGESANGKYPVESVKVMDEVARVSDTLMMFNAFAMESSSTAMAGRTNNADVDGNQWHRLKAVADAVTLLASRLQAERIVVADRCGGDLARAISSVHYNIPVVPVVSNERLARQLVLHRALFPVVSDNPDQVVAAKSTRFARMVSVIERDHGIEICVT